MLRTPAKLARRTANPLTFWVIIPFFLCVSFAGHYFVYFSITRYFDISERENIWLAVIFGILSVSFIITSILAHYYDNRRTRYSYFLSSLWLGMGTYLLLTFGAIWLLALILVNLEIFLPLPFFGILGLIFSAIISVYGFYNAIDIHITSITVPIRNLPDAWVGKQIVQISDVHIGHILRGHFLRRVVNRVNALNPEVLCITGDLFDGMDGRLEHLVDSLDDITAPEGILYVDGNHETYLGVERALAVLEKTKTRILHDEIVTLEGLDFIGIDHPLPGEHRDLPAVIRSIAGYDPERPSVLLYHTPEQIEKIAKTGVDLELCGHTHRGQLWPLCYIPKLLFHGYDYGLFHIGDYSLYTSSGVGSWGPPMRVGSQSEIVVITVQRK